MNCVCHDEPAYWQRDRRSGDGYGFWRCAVTKREKQRAIDQGRRDEKNQRRRDKYDSDPIYRIELLMTQAARGRRRTISRRREALADG